MAFDKIKYDNDYQKNFYDRLIVNVPKGQKEVIKEHYTKKGYDSLNAYINDLVRRDLNPENVIFDKNAVGEMIILKPEDVKKNHKVNKNKHFKSADVEL